MDSHLDPDDLHAARLKVVVVIHDATASVLLDGEADIASRQYLKNALDCPELNSATTVELHVGSLKFCDASSVRELVCFARHARQAQHRVTTLGASPILRKLAQIMRVEEDLGLV